jgi:hypothetical protein
MTKVGYALANAVFVVVYLTGVGFIWTGLRQLITSSQGAGAGSLVVGFGVLVTLSMAEWIFRSSRLGDSP